MCQFMTKSLGLFLTHPSKEQQENVFYCHTDSVNKISAERDHLDMIGNRIKGDGLLCLLIGNG